MGSWKVFLAAILLSCVVIEVSSITIGNIFGTTRTELSPSESDEEPLEDPKKKGEHKPHKPPPKVPLPPVHKPVLPNKNKKPIKKEEIILATKTVFVEVTKHVTTHPVCMKVYGVKPPCLPYNPDQHHHFFHHGKDKDEEEHDYDEDYEEDSDIQPSATLESPEPTRILDSVSMSGGNEELDPAEVPLEEGRSARYLEVAMPTPTASLKATGEINEEPDINPRLVDKLFQKAPVKHYTTKTLWVTKVEKLIDHRVTATLLVKNCIPTDLHIPLCSAPHKVYAPGYGSNHGVFVEGQTGSHHVHNPGNNKPLIGSLTNLLGIKKTNKEPKPFAHHKPSQGHIITPAVHKPKPVHKTKPAVKPVHKPGYIPRDEITEAEASEIVETVADVPDDVIIEKEVEVNDEE